MSSPSFIHLRLHSEFSITDGIVRLDQGKDHSCPPVERAKADGMPALALTDLNNLFGMVKFYKAARGKGVKPIIGCDVWVENENNRDQPGRLLLLCQNRAGYGNLCELLSRAFRSNQYRGRAEISKSWLSEGFGEGLIALSGAHLGDIGQSLLNGNEAQARQLAKDWAACFPQRFYLELQRTGAPQAEEALQQTIALAGELDLPVVATHPIQFLDEDDFRAHEARVCIAEGYVLGDQRRPKHFTEQQYFKSQAEMAELFADVPEALANSVEIAKRCNLTVELGKSKLPLFPIPEGMTENDYLVMRAEEGLAVRMKELYPDEAKRAEQYPTYTDRLKFETATIIQMGFPGYFLIVADFINWAKHNGVPVGPGRGSGAGSLVAYSLGITDLDPLRYALLFERFLNPERVSMPDFDVDFCQETRYKVIDYVRHQYGEDAVSQIATFGTMAAKAVLRDVGRVLDMSYTFCDGLSKLIPAQPGKFVTLDQALVEVPDLKERYDNEEEVRELFELARKLEGMTRNVGMHAGGVLIAPGKLTDFCPLYVASGSEAVTVSQFDKDDVEAVGLVKFDFLGLRNLTIIELAVKYVKQLDPAFTGPLDTQHFDDPAAYDILKKANTTAVFQLESDGMKKLLAKLQPDRFEDIIAVLALYRPGPLGSGMVDDFILRKKGQQKIDYFHDDLKACLTPTYGVIVYQEQVMQISQIIGGYTLGGADMLRRAMGKKKAEEMAEHRAIFSKGADEKGYGAALAMRLFDLMEKFAEYGFNKSHTAAYAVVSYQTAWLKAHYPSAFMAATLSSELDNTDQLKVFYEDTLANKVKVLGPDINVSNYRFEPVSRTEIRYGLGAVKGTGEQAVESIVAERQAGGPFRDLFDFCRRVDKRIVNRRTIEALVCAGAFDAVTDHRASLLASVGLAMESAEQHNRSINQASLFGAETAGDSAENMVDVPRWGDGERLLNEKKSLGFYFSGHPYDAHRKELSAFVRTKLADLGPQQQPTLMAGVIYAIRTQMTRRGKMAFVTLDDGSGRQDIAVYSEMIDAHRDLLREDQLLVVEGKVSKDDYSGGFRVAVDKLMDLTAARTRFAKTMRLNCNGASNAATLKELLAPYRNGGCPVRIAYRNAGANCELELGEGWRVQLHDNLLKSLKERLREENVQVVY
ncbi:DNA-directed DNA polymerase [Sulfurimicrobium lacus]|uniref:DNA polymerase III subunit alpha n=1 Tax=Sulfurimicrobium lacus TaxID=2715678 RepID=A0A6F8VE74_9PROT|nr:DNA polymerase III subunit alpha [Sulfurimicrobium lacus]BCB28018.1 DNA-directed DNA polymerase [Sulfurimicrobium lacus]